ncbi:hypothetical protein DPMN_160361 [Dreissena polymorpha]|uniref:Uncharacterized protein n=1 Tax=Dreissena polymorpha TaxID=45954 RepID=A0A9D4EMP5_DREPO|nr:hypothetical protein DPMN_160361 [Dreissena polymorpha]
MFGCITTPKRPRSETSVCSGNRYEVLSDSRPSEEHLNDTMDFEDNMSTTLPVRRTTVKRRRYSTNGGSPTTISGHSRERLTAETSNGHSDSGSDIKNLPGSNFLNNEELFKILKTETKINSIPCGEKINAYVVLKQPGSVRSRFEFVDDCGIWEAGTTVNQYWVYTESSGIKPVYKHNGVYCSKNQINKTIQYVPYDPQPESICRLHRYYAKLKGDSSSRRISIVAKATGSLIHLHLKCVAEYLGAPTTIQTHGNAKSGESLSERIPKYSVWLQTKYTKDEKQPLK